MLSRRGSSQIRSGDKLLPFSNPSGTEAAMSRFFKTQALQFAKVFPGRIKYA